MMRTLTGLLAAATLLMLTAAGCRTESPPGGPGVEAERAREEAPVERTARYRAAEEDATFTVVAPRAATRVAPGRREAITININRGSAFHEDVQLEFETPTGVTVLPEEAVIHAGASQAKILVEADVDAVPGDTSILVRATPQTGRAVAVRVPVRIESTRGSPREARQTQTDRERTR